MASKSALGKLQDTVVGTVRGVVKDPVGTAKGTLALGRAVAEGVVGEVSQRIGGGHRKPAPHPPESTRATAPTAVSEKAAQKPAEPSPTDVARVVAKKAPAKKAPAKRAPAQKAPAKSTPSDKLPARKTPAKKAAPKAAAAPKAEAPKTAAEVVEDAELPSPIKAVGTSPASDPENG